MSDCYRCERVITWENFNTIVEDGEENIIDQILSCVDEKTKISKQDIVENKNLCFEGLSIDKYRRVVIMVKLKLN
mgnify:CR=1 FL=1